MHRTRPDVINQWMRPAKEVRQSTNARNTTNFTCLTRRCEVRRTTSSPRQTIILVEQFIAFNLP